MPTYTPELVESVIHQYVHTDKPTAQIAADHSINERDVTRIRHAAGVPRRGARVRALPPPMQLLLEATRELKAAAPPPAATPSPALGPSPNEPALPFSDASAIARIERLIEQELAAQEATRAELGSLARAPTERERCARTLSILTQTLRALMRLRAGAAPEQGPTNDYGYPADIDAFRDEFARRLDAFVASRTGTGSAAAAGSSERCDPV